MKRTLIFKRVLLISNNFCYYYNQIGQYLTSIKYSGKLIFNQYMKELNELHSFVIMHYFVSLLMLNNYNAIIKTYIKLQEDNSTINDFSYAIYILSEMIINDLSLDNLSQTNSFIEWIKEYKIKRNKKQLLSYSKNDYEKKLVSVIISEIS